MATDQTLILAQSIMTCGLHHAQAVLGLYLHHPSGFLNLPDVKGTANPFPGASRYWKHRKNECARQQSVPYRGLLGF